tara:strand:+ start:399 stop:719 length:321 start_codon:yes stop_codon:yes gene_type:complete
MGRVCDKNSGRHTKPFPAWPFPRMCRQLVEDEEDGSVEEEEKDKGEEREGDEGGDVSIVPTLFEFAFSFTVEPALMSWPSLRRVFHSSLLSRVSVLTQLSHRFSTS